MTDEQYAALLARLDVIVALLTAPKPTAAPKRGPGRPVDNSSLDLAINLLTNYAGEEVAYLDLWAEAQSLGVPKYRLVQAKRILGAETAKMRGREWYWKIPAMSRGSSSAEMSRGGSPTTESVEGEAERLRTHIDPTRDADEERARDTTPPPASTAPVIPGRDAWVPGQVPIPFEFPEEPKE